MDESFDRMIRSEADLHKTWDYIWDNPRKIGLVGTDGGVPLHLDARVSECTKECPARRRTRPARRGCYTTGIEPSKFFACLLASWSDWFGQNRSLSPGPCACARTGQGRHRARAGNFTHAADRRTIQGAVQFRQAPDARRRSAFSTFPPENGTMNGIKSVRAARASSSARARRFSRRSSRSVSSSWTRSTSTLTSRRRRRVTMPATWPSCAARWKTPWSSLARPRRRWKVITTAKQGKYTLLELPERVDNQKMPHVRVVDMRQAAHRKKGRRFFRRNSRRPSPSGSESGEQTILFLNRRGYSTALQCPKCGFVAQLPELQSCAHLPSAGTKTPCHICGHTENGSVGLPEPRNAKTRPFVSPAPARKKSRKRWRNCFPMRASGAWTPTR